MSNISVIDTFTATSGTTITRSGLNFGANVANRIIVIAFSFGASIARHIVAVTIGGVAATIAADTTGGANVTAGSAIYYATPSGTTGQSVSVQFDFGITQYSAVIYRAIASLSTPLDSGTVATTGTTVTTPIDVVNPGVVIQTCRAAGAPGIAISYSGADTLTSDLNGVIGNTYAQSHGDTTENATCNIGYTGGTSGNTKFIAAASWTSVVAGVRSMLAFWMGGASFDSGGGGGTANKSPPFFATYGRFGWRA